MPFSKPYSVSRRMLFAWPVAIGLIGLAGVAWADDERTNPRVAARSTHWAFQPPVRSAQPAVENEAWVRNGIDPFVLARLESERLTPSPEADRITLIRRLSLDLIGLPPTIAEVDAFLADRRDGAYERLVERRLGSAHYGERWARHWLDAARYADSDGYEKDKPRNVWFFRDWVINALNRDMPYNRFIIEQLAGDLLPNATQDQRVATGFLRNSMINDEGGADRVGQERRLATGHTMAVALGCYGFAGSVWPCQA